MTEEEKWEEFRRILPNVAVIKMERDRILSLAKLAEAGRALRESGDVQVCAYCGDFRTGNDGHGDDCPFGIYDAHVADVEG